MDNKERRGCFRVSTELIIDYRAVESWAIDHGSIAEAFGQTQNLVWLFEFQRLDAEFKASLAPLYERNRHLAECLSIQNRKFDCLVKHIATEEFDNRGLEASQVNLSESGLAFLAPKPLYKGSILALRLLFLNTFTLAESYARIVRCNEVKDKKHYEIGAAFVKLSDSQRKTLAKNILQIQQARKKRPNEI